MKLSDVISAAPKALTVLKDLAIVCVLLLLAYLVWKFMHKPVTSAPSKDAVAATVSPVLKLTPKIDTLLKTKTVRTYSDASKVKLKLPGDVLANSDVHIIQAAIVPADEHQQTVTTVLNTTTGESQSYVHEEPLPWLALNLHGDAGIYVGLKNGEKTGRLEVRQGLLQVKAVHFGVIGSLDQSFSGALKPAAFVGAGMWGGW
jgi:hypothetical protein